MKKLFYTTKQEVFTFDNLNDNAKERILEDFHDWIDQGFWDDGGNVAGWAQDVDECFTEEMKKQGYLISKAETRAASFGGGNSFYGIAFEFKFQGLTFYAYGAYYDRLRLESKKVGATDAPKDITDAYFKAAQEAYNLLCNRYEDWNDPEGMDYIINLECYTEDNLYNNNCAWVCNQGDERLTTD